MKLVLNRKFKGQSYTIGDLYINDALFCNTLEDKDRELNDNMTLQQIQQIKRPTITAIPTGTYKIAMDIVSPRFQSNQFYKSVCEGKLPRLLNVKGFEGVLIHCGNTDKDSAGCILVGENKVQGQVLNSRATFEKLYKVLKEANDKGEDITIQIQ